MVFPQPLDIYDMYCTLAEYDIFSNCICRWSVVLVNAMNDLENHSSGPIQYMLQWLYFVKDVYEKDIHAFFMSLENLLCAVSPKLLSL